MSFASSLDIPQCEWIPFIFPPLYEITLAQRGPMLKKMFNFRTSPFYPFLRLCFSIPVLFTGHALKCGSSLAELHTHQLMFLVCGLCTCRKSWKWTGSAVISVYPLSNICVYPAINHSWETRMKIFGLLQLYFLNGFRFDNARLTIVTDKDDNENQSVNRDVHPESLPSLTV